MTWRSKTAPEGLAAGKRLASVVRLEMLTIPHAPPLRRRLALIPGPQQIANPAHGLRHRRRDRGAEFIAPIDRRRFDPHQGPVLGHLILLPLPLIDQRFAQQVLQTRGPVVEVQGQLQRDDVQPGIEIGLGGLQCTGLQYPRVWETTRAATPW